MTTSTSITHADLSREVTTDNGDGTGTRITYAPDGTKTGTTDLTGLPVPEVVPPSTLDVLAALDPATATAAVAAGAGLVARAGDLWDALLGCSQTNTARAGLEVITDIALTAALPQETHP